MKTKGLTLFILAVTLVHPGARAYEITTHALITDFAYRNSDLNVQAPNSIVPILGFDRLDGDHPFSFYSSPQASSYYDDVPISDPATAIPPLNAFARSPQGDERGVIDTLISGGYVPGTSGAATDQRLRSWLMRGAVREDDNDARILVTVGFWKREPPDRDEDPFGKITRAVKHFYDPIYDRSFQYQVLCVTYTCKPSTNWSMGRTDPLNPGSDADDLNRRNHFTWQDARNNYWWALTLQRSDTGMLAVDALIGSAERQVRWASTVNDVGHVIHLLQDMAQPQHTRNDGHAPPRFVYLYPDQGAADAAFEAFTDYRVIRSYATASSPFSLPGNPLRMMDESLPAVNALAKPVFGEQNIYPGGGARVQFSTPVKFLTTRHIEQGGDDATILSRRGMADVSNRNFFTAGTLPGFRECQPPGDSGCIPTAGPTYTLPSNDLTVGYTQLPIDSGLRVNGRSVFLTEFARSPTDAIAPGYDSTLHTLDAYGGQVPLATSSTWVDIMPDDLKPVWVPQVGYTVSYNTLRYTADVMLPRAVGYSAGMIDFFFRGRIKVEAPQDGVFAITDQAIAHTVDADGYPRCTNTVPPSVGGEPPLCVAGNVFGFTKVRLKIRNDTPAIVESGTGTTVHQDLATTLFAPGPSGPRLVAVARYHRNLCYQPSLSGETVVDYQGNVTPAACANGDRSPYQEISVSSPQGVNATDLNGTTSIPVTFDFTDSPIPINATDLFVQVVYRGPLGEEPDGIAVGRFDLREPSYLTLWNNTDYAGCNGNWVTSSGGGCSFPSGIARAIGTARLCINAQLLYTRQPTSGNGSILFGHYVRMAALLDDQPKNTRGRLLVGTANDLVIVDKSLTGQVRQAPLEIETVMAPYVPDPFYIKRGIIGSFRPMPFYLISGADPQPANDMGANDVGSLSAPLNPPALADTGGVISFPNSPPAPNGACTSAPPIPFFDDEIAAARNSEATTAQ